jgi:hypothetical protein
MRRSLELSARARPDTVDPRPQGFVVEADRPQLGEVVQRVRDGRLRTNIGTVAQPGGPKGRPSSAFVPKRCARLSASVTVCGPKISRRQRQIRRAIRMKAIVVTDKAVGTAWMKLVERP